MVAFLAIFLGAFAVFAAGMRAMTCGLQVLLASSTRRVFGYINDEPFAAFCGAALVTALLHSSSATTVMAIGLVEAGVMGTAAGIAAVLGANLGTTATSQLYTLPIAALVLPTLAGGLLCLALAAANGARRRHRGEPASSPLRAVGMAATGFAMVFAGLELLSLAAGLLQREAWLAQWLSKAADHNIYGVVSGAAATAVAQSSTLMVGTIMSLASKGAITLRGAVNLVLGSNIGTAIPTLVAGISLGRGAGRRMAMVNLIFNLLGVLAFLPFTGPFITLVTQFGGTPARQVANAHGLFNLITVALALPLVRPWALAIEWQERRDPRRSDHHERKG